jgi:cobalt-zinc-cadmium efflux system protein
MTAVFLVAEIVGGILTNSLALLSDAAHMGTDALALGISLFAVRMSRRPPDAKRTYGFARMEAIGAMINGGMLFLVAGYILWEAVGVASQRSCLAGMLVIAALGLLVNLISMRIKVGSGEASTSRRVS